MEARNIQNTQTRRYIRRTDGWHVRRIFSYPKGTLTLTEEELTYDALRVDRTQDIVISLKDVEKVKLTQKRLLFQNVGIYTWDQQYVFQVRNGQVWVDEIANAVSLQKKE